MRYVLLGNFLQNQIQDTVVFRMPRKVGAGGPPPTTSVILFINAHL